MHANKGFYTCPYPQFSFSVKFCQIRLDFRCCAQYIIITMFLLMGQFADERVVLSYDNIVCSVCVFGFSWIPFLLVM